MGATTHGGLLRRDTSEETRRRAYLVGLIISGPTLPLLWVLQRETDAVLRWTQPLLSLVILALWLALLRRWIPVPRAERVMATCLVGFVIARIGGQLFMDAPLDVITTEVAISGFSVAQLSIVLVFLAFETRVALRVSAGLGVALTALVALKLALLPASAVDLPTAATLFRMLVAIGAGVLLVYALANTKDQLAESRTRAVMLTRMAFTDPLTNLPNRRALLDVIDSRGAAARDGRGGFCLVAVDLDEFKRVNDVHGHASGDEVLRAAARTLAQQPRPGDAFGRWGGEEFLLVTGEPTLEDGVALAEQSRRALAATSLPLVGRITGSFGVAAWQPGDTAETLLARSDEALYAAKARGRNQVVSRLRQGPSRRSEVAELGGELG